MKNLKKFNEFVNESNKAVSLAKTIAKGKYILVSGRKDDSSADYSPIEINRGTREFNEIADIIMSVAIDESTETINEANYGVTLRKEAQKAAKDFVSNLAKEYNMTAADAKSLAIDLDKVLSACEAAASYRDPSASGHGW